MKKNILKSSAWFIWETCSTGFLQLPFLDWNPHFPSKFLFMIAEAILHQLWIKLDVFSWIRPLVVPLKAAALLYQVVVGRYWWSERWGCFKGSPASVECSMWTASGRVISRRSAGAPAPACVHGALSFLCCLCHCGVYFLERVLSATLCVQLPKTHFHIIQLCHFVWIFSCVDVLEEIHWNKGFC